MFTTTVVLFQNLFREEEDGDGGKTNVCPSGADVWISSSEMAADSLFPS